MEDPIYFVAWREKPTNNNNSNMKMRKQSLRIPVRPERGTWHIEKIIPMDIITANTIKKKNTDTMQNALIKTLPIITLPDCTPAEYPEKVKSPVERFDVYDPVIAEGVKCIPYYMKPKNWKIKDRFMESMLQQGVIIPIRQKEVKAYMPTFQIPKKDGLRVITDCRALDKFIAKTTFDGQSAYTVIRQMQKYKFVAKLDLKNAYYNIRLGTEIRKYLAFVYKRRTFTWARLIQGIRMALRRFKDS